MHLHAPVKEEVIRDTAKKFIGIIDQLPPIRCAVKRQWRKREIYYLDILEISEQDVLFKVGCQAGTYIRKYCTDWSEKMGVGGHMAELVRTKAGPFKDNTWVTLHDLKDAYEIWKEGDEKAIRKIIKPVEFAVSHISKVWVSDNAVDSICHGADLSTPGISQLHDNINQGEVIAVMTLKNELVCLGEAMMNSQNMYGQEKGIAIKTKKVFMERGTYKKFVKPKE